MLVGSGFPPSLIPALQNIGILHHEKAELRILLQQSVYVNKLIDLIRRSPLCNNKHLKV